MAEILELSDKEFKTAMNNMLRAVIGKVDNMREQMGNVIRDGNSKEESKGNARIKTTVNRNEECL